MKNLSILFLLLIILPLKSFGQQENESKVGAFIMLAEDNYAKKDYDQALINLDSASRIDPDIGKIYSIRGMIYYFQDEPKRAINAFNNAVRFNQNDPETYYYRSISRHVVGDHRNYSLNDINTAIQLQPDNDNYYVQKALYLTSSTYPLPEYNLAIETISEAIFIKPLNAEYYNIRAKYKSNSNQTLASLIDYSKAIELDSERDNYYHDRGLIYLTIEDYLKAIDDFNSAIQIDPLNEVYIMNRGQARFNLTDYETAILDFTLSIDTIYRKINAEPGRITLDHPLNKSLRRAYLYRGSALL